MTDQTNSPITVESAAAVVAALTETAARIQQIALDQLGDWRAVDAAHQPAAIHHWQEVYDLAAATTAPAYSDGQVRLVNKALARDLDDARRQIAELRAAMGISPDTIRAMKRRIDSYHKLLHNVDQCAPAVLDVNALGLDFATALQAVRDELEG